MLSYPVEFTNLFVMQPCYLSRLAVLSLDMSLCRQVLLLPGAAAAEWTEPNLSSLLKTMTR